MLKKMFRTSITCTQLKSKFGSYSSFHLTIQGISFSDSINPNNWPEGKLVKRFYYKSGTDNVSNTQKSERSLLSPSEIQPVSYNCRGIKHSIPDVQKLCNAYDIIFLQQTWLINQNLD